MLERDIVVCADEDGSAHSSSVCLLVARPPQTSVPSFIRTRARWLAFRLLMNTVLNASYEVAASRTIHTRIDSEMSPVSEDKCSSRPANRWTRRSASAQTLDEQDPDIVHSGHSPRARCSLVADGWRHLGSSVQSQHAKWRIENVSWTFGDPRMQLTHER